jgi:hypothetical protein
MEAVQVPLPLIFGHHDLLPANFLDDGDRLWLIDYEYAGFGTALFDLAGVAANSAMEDPAAAELLAAYFGRAPDPRPLPRLRRDAGRLAPARDDVGAGVGPAPVAPGVDYGAYAAENQRRLDAARGRYSLKWGES